MDDPKKIREVISYFVDAVINNQSLIDPFIWDVYCGYSYYSAEQIVPPGMKDNQRANRLNLTNNYILEYDKQKLAFKKTQNATGTDAYLFEVPDFSNKDEPKNYQVFYLLNRKADLVYDDAEEFAKCRMGYNSLTELPESIRKRLYSQPLNKLIAPKNIDGLDFVSSEGSVQFFITAAMYATYDISTPEVKYYEKYIDPKSKIFSHEKLSDDYLLKNFKPFELEIDELYLWLTIVNKSGDLIHTQLIKCKLDIDKYVDKKEVCVFFDFLVQDGETLSSFAYYNELDTLLNTIKDQSPKLSAIFFYSMDGCKDLHKNLRGQEIIIKDLNLKFDASEQVVDVISELQELFGEEDRTRLMEDPLYQDFNCVNWLTELIELKFKNPWIEVYWNVAADKPIVGVDRNRLFLNELSAEANALPDGPLKTSIKAAYTLAEKDDNVIFVKRGYRYATNVSIIGSDSHYVYLWHADSGILTRMPLSIFWRGFVITELSKDIHSRTEGILAFTLFYLGIAAFAATAAVAAGAGLVAAISIPIRAYLADKLKGAAINFADNFWEFKKEFIIRQHLYAIGLFLKVLPQANGKKIALVRGFLLGYSEGTFLSFLKSWQNFIDLEPSSVKAIKYGYKAVQFLDILQNHLNEIKAVLDSTASEKLLANLLQTMDELTKGITGLIGIIQFLDYDNVNELLDFYVESSKKKPITQEEWDKARKEYYDICISIVNIDFKKGKDSIQSSVDDIQKALPAIKLIVAGSIVLFISNQALAGKLTWLLMLLGVGVPLTGLHLNGTIDVPEIIKEFAGDCAKKCKEDGPLFPIWWVLENLSKYSEEKNEKIGYLVGTVVGNSTFNSKFINKKPAGDTKLWKPKQLGKSFLLSQVELGIVAPIIKIIFANYLELIELFEAKGEKVVKDSSELVSKIREIIDNLFGGEELDFLYPDEGVSFISKLITAVFELKKNLETWIVQLSKYPNITEAIDQLEALVKKTKPDKFPSLKKIMSGELEEWSKEAMLFVIVTQILGSLDYISSAFETMNEKVVKSPEVDIYRFLEILGLSTGRKHLNDTMAKYADGAADTTQFLCDDAVLAVI